MLSGHESIKYGFYLIVFVYNSEAIGGGNTCAISDITRITNKRVDGYTIPQLVKLSIE